MIAFASGLSVVRFSCFKARSDEAPIMSLSRNISRGGWRRVVWREGTGGWRGRRLSGHRFGRTALLVIVTILLALPASEGAWAQREIEQQVGRHACRWVWDCTRGQCKHVSQCAEPNGLVPPEPKELPPLSPVDSGPFMVPDTLPAGGSHCPPRRTCDQMGECVWEVKC